MKKAILFDIDGTLLDAHDFVFDAVKYSLNIHGYSYPEAKLEKKAVGRPILEFYEVLAPGADPKKLAKTHHEFQQKNAHLIKPFPNTKMVLQDLKNSGFLIAAVSNRSRESLIPSLKFTGIFNFFDVVFSLDDVVHPKPHKEHLLVALKSLQVKPSSAYMVGDTENDILAGKAAKVKTVGVTYSLLGKNIAKHKPDFIIDDIGELLEILR